MPRRAWLAYLHQGHRNEEPGRVSGIGCGSHHGSICERVEKKARGGEDARVAVSGFCLKRRSPMWTKAPSRDLVLVCQKEVIGLILNTKAEGLKTPFVSSGAPCGGKIFCGYSDLAGEENIPWKIPASRATPSEVVTPMVTPRRAHPTDPTRRPHDMGIPAVGRLAAADRWVGKTAGSGGRKPRRRQLRQWRSRALCRNHVV